ncbi:PSMD10 [Mytilus edulis]|uniref:PSMD10 n=1 Tax=Mytilus edulis TaxID=6550 RepID=A0A8S3S512_MYTED|nr:PSMD10 [Mytilus edulis]
MFSDKVQLKHVQYLLKKGMDFRRRDKMGSTVLHMIMSPPDDPIENTEDDELESRDNEIIQIVKFLVNRGLNVNEPNLQSLTPLHYAVQKGRKHLVEILLKLGADPTAKTKTGETSCHIASKHPEILEIILETHCSSIVNIQDNFGSTVFHWAIWYQDNSSFSLLLNRGFDPVVENSDDHKDAFGKYAGLIRDSCDMGLYYNTDENHDIAQYVKMTNPILECNVTLSGSRKEGQNDEFDIKWHILKFNEHVEPIELPEFPKGFVKLKAKRWCK